MAENLSHEDMYLFFRSCDQSIIKHYNDNNLSDDDYFKYGIYSDLASNAISILLNLLQDNKQSMGVDLSCRAILEAAGILQMDEKGYIKPTGKKMYRYLYSKIEYNCLTKFNSDSFTIDEREKTNRDLESFYEAATEHFGCSKEKVKKSNIINSPYCYLATKLNDDTSIAKIFEKYGIDVDGGTGTYAFFSSFVHPRLEYKKDTEDLNYLARDPLIEAVLMIAYRRLDGKIQDMEDFTQTINSVFADRPDLSLEKSGIKNVLEEMVTTADSHFGEFEPFFFKKMKYLLKDMILNIDFGFYEMVVSKAKIFIEMYATQLFMYRGRTIKEVLYITDCFLVSSKFPVFKFLNKIDSDAFPYKKLTDEWKNFLKPAFDEYYKNKYRIDDYDAFFKELEVNPIYPFKNQRRNYSLFVKSLFQDASLHLSDYEDIMTLYTLSLNMDHASGYNFNSTSSVSEYYANDTIDTLLNAIVGSINHLQEMTENFNVKTTTNFDSARDYLDKLIDSYQNREVQIIVNHLTFVKGNKAA